MTVKIIQKFKVMCGRFKNENLLDYVTDQILKIYENYGVTRSWERK